MTTPVKYAIHRVRTSSVAPREGVWAYPCEGRPGAFARGGACTRGPRAMTADRTDTVACPMPASTFDSLRAASVNRHGHPHRWLASDFVTDAWEFVARAIDAAVAEAVSSPRGAPLSQQELVAGRLGRTPPCPRRVLPLPACGL